jgi:molybdopterin/thiamine biosynthesis adenylyltransferase
MNHIYFIGLGGIGSQLCEPICRFINHFDDMKKWKITFIDGDDYESSNKTRQLITFKDLGKNKAKSQYQKMYQLFPQLELDTNAIYINKQNIKDCIDPDENIFILSGVDNHKTRHVIQEYCLSLNNVLLLSGGNEYIDGDVQIFARKNEKNLLPPIWKYNPDILKPKDKSPDEIGCDELVKSEPQLIFTNGMVSSCMQMAFYNYYEMFDANKEINIDKSVIMFDITEMAVVSKKRQI